MIPEVDEAVPRIASQFGLVDNALQAGYPFGEQPLRGGPGDQPHSGPVINESLDGWKRDHQVPKSERHGSDKRTAHRQRGAYRVLSSIPASANAFRRSAHLLQVWQ